MVSNEFYLSDLWQNIINHIENNQLIPEEGLNEIKGKSKIYSLTNEKMMIECEYFITQILINQNIHIFSSVVSTILNREFDISTHLTIDLYGNNSNNTLVKNDFIKRTIERNYTFDNFVVGRSNIQSQVSALTVATNPGVHFNPLFIYGNSGLGKTHLLNAIGNKIHEQFPDYKIGIVSGLDFVEGVSESIRNRTIDEFKKEFYNLDVLLVDDIQFIAGKEKTHEIFFSVFNELVNNKKQICLTSDRMPKDIKGLEDRIISRFNQGLNVNIEAPEYETSINILKKKLASSGTTNIDDEVLSYIATNFSQDVRQLEGALNRLLFYSVTFMPVEHITLKVAAEAFKDQMSEISDDINVNTIKKVVCDYYGVTKQQLNSKIRTKNIANPRQIAMYLIRKFLDMPYKDIGMNFGKRDHSTVINACERVEENIKKDPNYLKAIQDLEAMIK